MLVTSCHLAPVSCGLVPFDIDVLYFHRPFGITLPSTYRVVAYSGTRRTRLAQHTHETNGTSRASQRRSDKVGGREYAGSQRRVCTDVRQEHFEFIDEIGCATEELRNLCVHLITSEMNRQKSRPKYTHIMKKPLLFLIRLQYLQELLICLRFVSKARLDTVDVLYRVVELRLLRLNTWAR